MTVEEPKLLQLKFKDDPWKLLVACILLNKTQRKQVDQVIDRLFADYPNASALELARIDDLTALLGPLGLGTQRSRRLVRFCRGWIQLVGMVEDGGMSVATFLNCLSNVHGVGDYALDSYRMFVLGEWRDVEPEDKELKRWRGWALEHL